jgi:hypothetical protein
MADPKFDPAAHGAQAQQLQALATQARAALRKDSVERTSRLGQERDDAARRAYGAEQEAAATRQQDERELNAAEKLDGEAAVLERRAADMEHRGVDRGTAEMAADLREQAAEQRALAEAARNRAHSASQAGDRLRQEAIDQRAKVEQLEADLAAEPKRRQQFEEAVDNLEFNASEAAYTADQARKAAEFDARAEAAAARGDNAAAGAARAQATTIRDDITQRGLNRELFTPAADQLGQLGITVPANLLVPPGFDLQAAAAETSAPTSTTGIDASTSIDSPATASDEPGTAAEVDVVTGEVDGQPAEADASRESAADVFTTDGELVGSDLGESASELSSRIMAELFDEGHTRVDGEPEPFNAPATIDDPVAAQASFGDEAASDFAADAFAVSDIAGAQSPESDATTGLIEN